MRAIDNPAFQELKQLIEKRQAYEKEQQILLKDKNIPTPNPTTWDFTDINGNTLLFYAVQAGDKEEVEALLTKNKLANSHGAENTEEKEEFISDENLNEIGSDENLNQKESENIGEEFVVAQEKPITEMESQTDIESENESGEEIESNDTPLFNYPLEISQPLIEALNQGNFEIAELLYEHLQNYESSDLKLTSLKNVEAKHWLKEKIKNEIKQSGILAKNNFSLPEKPSKLFQSFEGLDYNPSILQHFAEIGRDDYFKWLQKNNIALDSDDLVYLLKCAIESENLNKIGHVIKYIEKQNLAPAEDYPFKKDKKLLFRKGLNYAIEKEKFKIADFLLKNGADLDGVCDKNGNTIFGKSILKKEVNAIRYLLPKITNIFQQKNYAQQNILHLAVQSDSDEIKNIINQLNLPKELTFQKDIFGFTPEDYNSKHEDDQAINQDIINNKLSYYCLLKYLELHEDFNLGLCNGYSRLFQLYNPEYFYNTLQLLSGWDGKEESLLKPLASDIPQARYYRNLDELFRGWLNDLLSFVGYKLKDRIGINLHQHDRIREQEILTDDKNLLPVNLYETEQRYFLRHKGMYENLTEEQVREILFYYLKMPSQVRLELKGYAHATAARKQGNNILYYDSNLPKKIRPLSSLEELVQLILDTKYKTVGHIFTNVYDPKNIDLEFLLYVHENEMAEFIKNSSYKLIDEKSLPKSSKEAKDFQEASANHFTPLHLAILGRDVVMFQKLIADGYCDVNAKDSSNRDVFTLAVESNFNEAIDLLLQNPNLNYDCFNESDGLLKIYQDDNQTLLNKFLRHPKIILNPDLFTEALFREDDELIDHLLKDKKFQFSAEKLNLQLRVALNAKRINESAVAALLLQGASLLEPNNVDKKNEPFFYYEAESIKSALQLTTDSYEISKILINVLKKIFKEESKNENKDKTNLDFSIMQFLAQCSEMNLYQEFSEKELLNILKVLIPKQAESESNSNELNNLFTNLALHSLLYQYDSLFKYLQENIKYSAASQRDIFYKALELKRYDQIKFLITQGYDINMKLDSNTPSNLFYFFQHLLDISYPIFYVLHNSFPEDMVHFFLDHGANLDVRNNQGQTARELLEQKYPQLCQSSISAARNG